ncbi:hypothetical protein Tco_1140783 [Tanacetum coccineum]
MNDLNNHIAFLIKNFETLKQESSDKYEKNITEIVDLEKVKKELENIVFNQQPALYNGTVLIKEHNPVSVRDSGETLILAEERRLKMLEKQTIVNTKPIAYSKLNKLYEIFVPQTQLSAEQLYWSSTPSPPFDECIKRRTTLSPHKIGSWEQLDIKAQKSQNTQCELPVVDSKIQKIEDENMSLAFQVSSLVKEREHIKLEYKKLYDSIKQTLAKMKLQTYSLQQKLNDQIFENNKLRAQLKGKFSESQMNHNGKSLNTKLSKPLNLGAKLYSVTLFPKSKIESKPINAYFKNNRVVHHDYLKVTKEHVATLHELLAEARALKPFDEHIGHASKFAERIQELLIYVSASCPFTQSWNEKWAPATSHRKNNKPYIDASRTKQTIETITQKHAVKQNTRKTSIGRVSSTNASISKPKSNTKNDRIPQLPSRRIKNKVEALHRKFKSSANKNNHVSDCNANVKNIALSKNFDTIYISCNECLFSTNHDACVVQYLKKNAKT